jgi:XTP/dITP diphosphohydrolase
MELVIATRNHNKARELKHFLSDLNLEVVSMAQFPDIQPIEEDGKTFEENAVKKATLVALSTGLLTLADDSGLEVDSLDGRPGIFSARYAGEDASDIDNNEKLLKELDGVINRTARFVCCVALADANGLIATVRGSCEGQIIDECRGNNGFGYDPLFMKNDYNHTFGEIKIDLKNRISHRSRALEKARLAIENYLLTGLNNPD